MHLVRWLLYSLNFYNILLRHLSLSIKILFFFFFFNRYRQRRLLFYKLGSNIQQVLGKFLSLSINDSRNVMKCFDLCRRFLKGDDLICFPPPPPRTNPNVVKPSGRYYFSKPRSPPLPRTKLHNILRRSSLLRLCEELTMYESYFSILVIASFRLLPTL